MASLRIDPQGKAYGQMALEMTIPTPLSWATDIGEREASASEGAAKRITSRESNTPDGALRTGVAPRYT
jgi:hypothetical protein